MLKILDLFSGIGGFSLGLEKTGGFQTVAFCEIEEYPRRVLNHHWPGVPCYEDVRMLNGAILSADGIAVDVITGGFPCQDISISGRRDGIVKGSRSGLWSEIVRLTCDLRPRYVIVENVANLLRGPSEKRGGWFGRVLGDLAECGYDAEWENIPAAALGYNHRRERVWIVAYPNEIRNGDAIFSPVMQKAAVLNASNSRLSLHDLRGMDKGGNTYRLLRNDGFSEFLAGLSACGNAVVPAIPELIGRWILAFEAAQVATRRNDYGKESLHRTDHVAPENVRANANGT